MTRLHVYYGLVVAVVCLTIYVSVREFCKTWVATSLIEAGAMKLKAK